MARMRTIHPGLFNDVRFCTMSPAARVLLMAIWCDADDAGVFELNPIDIKMRLMPADHVDVLDLIEEMVGVGLVMVYEVNGRRFGACRSFVRWQQPRAPKYRYPQVAAVRDWVGADEKRDPFAMKKPPRDLPETTGAVLAMVPVRPKPINVPKPKRVRSGVYGTSKLLNGEPIAASETVKPPSNAALEPVEVVSNAALTGEIVSPQGDIVSPQGDMEPLIRDGKGGTIGGEGNNLSSPTKTQDQRVTESPDGKGGAGGKTIFRPPGWVPIDAWNAFVEVRNRLRRPMTANAANLIVRKLWRLVEAGNDPEAVLSQSVEFGWLSVYPLKEGLRDGRTRTEPVNTWVRAATRAEGADRQVEAGRDAGFVAGGDPEPSQGDPAGGRADAGAGPAVQNPVDAGGPFAGVAFVGPSAGVGRRGGHSPPDILRWSR